ncbi:MAG: DUF4404 family protein [Steroidobacteraceae bacterium]
MSTADLRELLRRLHAELARAESLDPSRASCWRSWRRPVALPGALSATRSAAVRFEADHPALAAALRQIADAFAKAGI